MSNENKPVHRIRLSTISAAIFKNETGAGKVYYNAQFDRSYKDGEDWKHSKSFGRDDLHTLSEVISLTDAWMQQQNTAAAVPDTPGLN